MKNTSMIFRNRIRTFNLIVCAAVFVGGAAEIWAQATDPSAFTVVREHGRTPIAPGDSEVDKGATIEISFDAAKMAKPASGSPQVSIDVEAWVVKDGRRTRVYTINNYSTVRGSVSGGPASDGAVADTTTFVRHTKNYDPATPGMGTLPNTHISLLSVGAADADALEIRVVNRATQNSALWIFRPRAFGLRPSATDSLFFIRRFGVGDADRSNGVEEINFTPSPGVTWGGVYFARKNPLVRFLQPGIGVNVSFMNWKDPAFDVTTNRFVRNTTATDVNVGMGVQASLFNNVIQFTYGANLHTTQDRLYFGVGLSFIQLGTKIASLVTQQGGAPAAASTPVPDTQ